MAGVLSHQYLSERAVKGIAHYKYKASGYTWLDDLHNPVWNWLVENTLPMWLAPNLVTLTGLMFIVTSTVLMTIYAPQVNGIDAPAWVHIFGGCAIITYVNLDCMDGKQARRTGSSSPLGQLFDHGCDALSVGLILFNVASSVGLNCGPLLIGMAYVPMTTWMLAQWEEYHTGNMLYGNGIFGVLEANYALAIAQIMSGLFGVHIWQAPLQHTLRVSMPEVLDKVSPLQILFGTAVVCMGIQAFGQFYRVFHHDSAHEMDSRERGHKDLSQLSALKHIFFFLGLFSIGYLQLNSKTTGLYECRAGIFCFCIAYTVMATQLIIAHMSKDHFRPFWWPLVALLMLTVNAYVHVVPQEPLVFATMAVMFALYMHFIACVIQQVCATLGISCFVIKPKQDA